MVATLLTSRKEVRHSVLTRDFHKCQDCGVNSTRLVVHHLEYPDAYPVVYGSGENLVTLCYGCHSKRHRPRYKRVASRVHEGIIVIDPGNSHRYTCSMHLVKLRNKVRAITSPLPPDIVDQAKCRLGLGITEFVDQYEVEYLYSGVEGCFLSFVQREAMT